MTKEPKPMREIHQIQESISEKEKDLSPRERIKKLHEESAEVIKRYGLKIKMASKA